MLLTEKIVELPSSPSETTTEKETDSALEYFESSLTTIFNHVRNQHGEPGKLVQYNSSNYGPIKLALADPDKEDTRLFSHFLWNAGVEVAGMIEQGEVVVDGKEVLEVGAGRFLYSLS